MRSITAEQFHSCELPNDMDDAYIKMQDPYNQNEDVYIEVWDVLIQKNDDNEIGLIIAPKGKTKYVSLMEPVFYS